MSRFSTGFILPVNAQPAPFGLSLGPYASYYGISLNSTYRLRETDLSQTGEVKTNFNMFNLGLGIGCQFVFWEKLSIDLPAFGPSLTYEYKKKKSSGFNMPTDNKITSSNPAQPANTSDFPLFGHLIEIYNQEPSASFTTFFRYALTFGFRF